MSTAEELTTAASGVATDAAAPIAPRPGGPRGATRWDAATDGTGRDGAALHSADADGAEGEGDGRDATHAPRSLLKAAGSVVAPTTFVTGLLVYFGWSHAYWFFHYFGVHATLLELTTQDYLMRSADGLFVPITSLACAAIAGVWLHRLARRWVPARMLDAIHRFLAEHTGAIGFVLAGAGLWGMLATTPLEVNVVVSPLCLGAGAVLLTHGVRTGRARDPASAPAWVTTSAWVAMFVLAGLSLFWVAHDYSADVGVTRAMQLERELADEPSVWLYSAQRLAVGAQGVREVACGEADAAYRFRYDGLKLVMQAGDQYIFLPEGWSRDGGSAVLLPRGDSIRLEFSPPFTRPRRAPVC